MGSNDGLGLCKPSCERQQRDGESPFMEIWIFFTQKQFELCHKTMVGLGEGVCGGWGQAQVNMVRPHSLVDMKERGQVQLERWVRALNGRI